MGLSIHFSHPWLLFLLIPAAAIILIPHFTLKKKYRRTRNRIVAMVLESIILTLAVFMLAGMTFVTTLNNNQNQIILLVDVSDTQEKAQENRDELVARILNNAENDGYNVGIVTFGFTQEYAVPLTGDVNGVYQRYLRANKPDTSATDIAAALNYTKDLFTSDAAKIVLITDGKETDEKAESVIRAISVRGISVDVAYVPSEYGQNEIQLTGIELPDYHVNLNEQCSVSLNLQSSAAADAVITLYDNGEKVADGERTVSLTEGVQKITFTSSFAEKGLHELTFKVAAQEKDDTIQFNNIYSTYLNLEVFDKILILESKAGQSDKLETMLGGAGYKVTITDVADKESLPATIDALREYDQVILNNIASSDFRENNPAYGSSANEPRYIYPFVDMLQTYVYDYGGGLLTTGGGEGEIAHAYNRQDLYGTTLQELLPVQAVKYTPPLGLVIIIDRSGSMANVGMDGKTALEWARSGAVTCLDNMAERDYIGILTLDLDYNTVLTMTPCTQQAKIRTAINSIDEANGGTSYPEAIDRAGRMLKALENVDKRHIILISDGMAYSETERKIYEASIKNFYENDKITFSAVGIGIAENSREAEIMKSAADLGHGRVHAVTDGDKFIKEMRDELNVKDIKEVNFDEPFAPLISNALSPVMKGVERGEEGAALKHMTVTLGGFYGVKAKSSADVILTTDYGAPIYAQWKFGNGMVGSFMCDVYGNWSGEFLNNVNGKQFLSNLVFNLMPLNNIRPNDINVEINGENYMNQLSVYTTLPTGSYLRGKIEYTTSAGQTVTVDMNEITENVKDKPCYVVSPLSAQNNYTRSNFVIKGNGVYKITLTKYNSSDEAVGEYVTYKEFSYSKEYDVNAATDGQALSDKLAALAEAGDGKLIADNEAPWEIFEDFVVLFSRVYDPRLLFAIISIVLFLVCVAVRKFKFKWPHEIIREHREKKRNGKK